MMLSHKPLDPESIRLNLSIQKEFPIKMHSLLSERIEAEGKLQFPKTNLKSQISLVDEQSTVREKFKRLNRQSSCDDLKRVSSPFFGSNR